MTARWVVDEIRPNRDLTITWQPISLLKKNDPAEDSDYYKPVLFTHKLLRVMEAARAAEGDAAVERLYWHFATLIHHDQNRDFNVADEVEAAGFERRLAESFEDDSLDAEIATRMDEGIALAGNDIGTPIIAFANADDEKVALFGPVITRVPPTELSLQLWDGFMACATVPGFWELKRTRTERPEFGERPS